MGCSCPKTHTEENRRILGRFASLSARQGLGIYMVESVATQCTLRRGRDGGKGKRSRKRVCPTGNRVRSLVCKKGSGIQNESSDCIACQGATASARPKGAAVVEVRCRARNGGRGVAHNVHDTRLTGAIGAYLWRAPGSRGDVGAFAGEWGLEGSEQGEGQGQGTRGKDKGEVRTR